MSTRTGPAVEGLYDALVYRGPKWRPWLWWCASGAAGAAGAAADFRRALELPCPPVVREEALGGLRDLGMEAEGCDLGRAGPGAGLCVRRNGCCN